jgi:predicted nucleotidyltransferase
MLPAPGIPGDMIRGYALTENLGCLAIGRYNISMVQVSVTLLDQMVQRLATTLHPQQVYLFGSYAYGTPHTHSDLDFLVVVPDGAGDPDDLALAGRRALLDFPVSVDIVIYTRSQMDKWSPVRCSLPNTVVNKGKRLYAA